MDPERPRIIFVLRWDAEGLIILIFFEKEFAPVRRRTVNQTPRRTWNVCSTEREGF